MYLILRLCFCVASLICWYKMWFCILYIIHATLGTFFLLQIDEGNATPCSALADAVGWGWVGVIAPIHLQPGAGVRWVGSIRFLSLYPRAKALYLLYRWLNGPCVQSGEFDPRTVQPLASRYTRSASADST